MKSTAFRIWLQRIYMDHKDEAMEYGQPVSNAAGYFRLYKYWLKREYRYQQNA